MNCRQIGLLIVVLAAVSACSDETRASAAPVASQRERTAPPRTPVVTAPASPYRVVPVAAGGSIRGMVQAGRDPIPDTVTATPETHPGCAPRNGGSLPGAGAKLGGAIVWVTDARQGRGFPAARRLELTSDDCLLTPKTLVVFIGATLNFGTNDAALHHHRFINVETGETDAVAPFNDSGEVIPFDRLFRKTAQYDVVCELHPWSRASVIVLDHPYYSVTGADGSFAMDGLLPGTYRVRAWHPSYGLADGTVTVAAGQPASLSLSVGGSAAAAPPLADSAKPAVATP